MFENTQSTKSTWKSTGAALLAYGMESKIRDYKNGLRGLAFKENYHWTWQLVDPAGYVLDMGFALDEETAKFACDGATSLIKSPASAYARKYALSAVLLPYSTL